MPQKLLTRAEAVAAAPQMTASEFSEGRCIVCSHRRRGYRCRGFWCRSILAAMPQKTVREIEAAAHRERQWKKMETIDMIDTATKLFADGRTAAARTLFLEIAERLGAK